MSVRNTVLPVFVCILLLASFALPATPWRHIVNDFMPQYIPMTQEGTANTAGTYQVNAHRNDDGSVAVSGSGHIPYDGPVAGTVSFEVNPNTNSGSYQVTEQLFDSSASSTIHAPKSPSIDNDDNNMQSVTNPMPDVGDTNIPAIYRNLDDNGNSRS